jgi:serine/threonine protein kinase
MAYIEENAVIANRYKLINKLGCGAYSEVWEALDQKISDCPKVALKIYEPELGLDQLFIELFSKEFSNTLNLNHPNILAPKHFDIFQGSPFLILPFCSNGSLKKKIKMNGALSEDEIIKVLSEIGSAIYYLHEHEPTLIHQDIKPDNIMINDVNDYLLSDFGISTLWHTTSKFTSGKEFMFTRPYAPPEKFGMHPVVSPSVDIFAFGVTIHELATGEIPWNGEGGLALLKGELIPDLPDSISGEINELIKKCLSKEPEIRPKAKDIILFTKDFKKRKFGTTGANYLSHNDSISLSQPRLSYPHDQLTGLSLNIRFSWKSVDFAHDYTLQVSRNEDFTDIICEILNVSSTFREVKLPFNNTEYYWRVKAQRSKIESDWSEIWKFTTHKENYKTLFTNHDYKVKEKDSDKKNKYHKTEIFSIIAISIIILILVYFLIINLFPKNPNLSNKLSSSESSGYSLNKFIFQREEQIFKADGSINTTPLLDDSIVFFGSRDHNFYSFNYLTKSLKWKFKSEGPVQSSPVKDSLKVYFGSHDMNFYALSRDSGKVIWKFRSSNIIESSPSIYENSIYFGCDDGYIYSLNKENGYLNWKFKAKNKIFAKPVVYKDIIYIGSLDSNMYILSKDGVLINSIHANGSIFSTPDIIDDNLCFCDDAGILYVYSIKDNKMKWDFNSQGSIFSSPRINDNVIYFGNNNGSFFGINIKNKYSRWKPVQTNGMIVSTPVIDQNNVYFGSSDSTLYGIDISTGIIKRHFKTNGSILSSPVIHNGKIFFGASDGFLYQI